jgi:hypothetical protein
MSQPVPRRLTKARAYARFRAIGENRDCTKRPSPIASRQGKTIRQVGAS